MTKVKRAGIVRFSIKTRKRFIIYSSKVLRESWEFKLQPHHFLIWILFDVLREDLMNCFIIFDLLRNSVQNIKGFHSEIRRKQFSYFLERYRKCKIDRSSFFIYLYLFWLLFSRYLPVRSCGQTCPTLVSSIDVLMSFNWTMVVEMTWIVDIWASTRFEASSMAASLLTNSWFPSNIFFSLRTSNWLSNRRNSSWKEAFLSNLGEQIFEILKL